MSARGFVGDVLRRGVAILRARPTIALGGALVLVIIELVPPLVDIALTPDTPPLDMETPLPPGLTTEMYLRRSGPPLVTATVALIAFVAACAVRVVYLRLLAAGAGGRPQIGQVLSMMAVRILRGVALLGAAIAGGLPGFALSLFADPNSTLDLVSLVIAIVGATIACALAWVTLVLADWQVAVHGAGPLRALRGASELARNRRAALVAIAAITAAGYGIGLLGFAAHPVALVITFPIVVAWAESTWTAAFLSAEGR